MSNQKVKVAVVGASGYSGEELVRLLLRHPGAELTAVTSRQYAGQALSAVFPRFVREPRAQSLHFSEPSVPQLAEMAEVVFLALPHGLAAEFAGPLLKRGRKVIDLSADFRVRNPSVYREFYGHDHPAPDLLPGAVYGMPEIYRHALKHTSLVAAPGCYPTSILLPIIPLLEANLVKATGIIADSMSGVSGAGRKVESDFLFVECNESVRPYSVPKHRHLSEIEQELSGAAGEAVVIQFTPHLIPVNRGILTTLYLAPKEHFGDAASQTELQQKLEDCFRRRYGGEPFVQLLYDRGLPDTKHVVGTNSIAIGWRLDPRTGRLILMSAIDNLVKGASGQAVQAFNVCVGFAETDGLL